MGRQINHPDLGRSVDGAHPSSILPDQLLPLATEKLAGVAASRQALELAWRYKASLQGFFSKRVRNAADVDDLVQDVFTKLLQRGEGEPIEKIEPYLFRTAANVLRDRERRDSAREQDAHECFDESTHVLRTELSPERIVLGEEALQAVSSVLRTLPERTRHVFVMRALERRRYSEIAQLLCISTRAVEKHMEKALVHLDVAMGSLL